MTIFGCLTPGGGPLSRSGREHFISATAEDFDETGEWPTIDRVQGKLFAWRYGTSASREARRLPRSMGEVDGGTVALSVRSFYADDPSRPLLHHFCIALRDARERYRARGRKAVATISAEELSTEHQIAESDATRVMEVLAVEGLVKKGSENESWAITSRIRHYAGVGSVADYLHRKGRFERRRCWRTIATKPFSVVRSAIGSGGAGRGIVIGALGILLASFFLWLGSELLPSSDGAHEPASSKSTPAETTDRKHE